MVDAHAGQPEAPSARFTDTEYIGNHRDYAAGLHPYPTGPLVLAVAELPVVLHR
jgi:hypothetical protein